MDAAPAEVDQPQAQRAEGSDAVAPVAGARGLAGGSQKTGDVGGVRGGRWLRRVATVCAAFFIALILAALGLALAVERSPLEATYAGPAPLPAAVAARFAYPEAGTPASPFMEWGLEDRGTYSLSTIKLRVTTPGFEPHDVQVIHYRAHTPGRRPAVVVTPILGGSGEVARAIARALAVGGTHVAVVLRAQSALVGDAPEEHLEVVLRTAVIDRRRTVDWLCGRADVDPQRIGSCGVSMGGLVATILAAVEPRVRASVLALAGGDLADVLTTSDQPRVRRYVRERAEHGVAGDALPERVRAAVPSDPLRLAPYVDARRVLFVAARRDTTVPYVAQERLHRALGGPEQIILPTGHYTSAVYFPWLVGQIARFYAETL